MSEKTGTVTGFIKKRDGTVFGLNIDGDEYLYSFPDKRAEPWDADQIKVGDTVRVEYSPYEKDGKTKQYLAVIELLEVPIAEPDEAGPSFTTDDHASWGYRQRDILMLLESCTKGACTVYASALTGGALKVMPGGGELTALARTLETHNIERFRALMEAL